MILPDTDGKTSFKSPERDEGVPSPEQSPPPYSPPSQGLSVGPTPQISEPPLDLAPTNYIHLKEQNNTVNRKILLDLSVPRPPASVLPEGTQGEDTPHLLLESHNGSVFGEVWVLRANREDTTTHEGQKLPAARERVHLQFRSYYGTAIALVHVHPSTVEPRPFLDIDAEAPYGSVTITIPRSFRGQLKLHSEYGSVSLSSALAPRAATLSVLNGAHTYFVGERPSSGMWHTGESGDGEKVDGLIGSSKYGSVKVSYDDEVEVGVARRKRGPGILNSLFKAIGFRQST